MPDMDGFEVAAEVAKRPELAGATVMMLSSSGDYDEQSRCAALGIAACLTKPVYADDLVAAIEGAVGCKLAARWRRNRRGGAAWGRRRRARSSGGRKKSQSRVAPAGDPTGHHVNVRGDGREACDTRRGR